MFCLKDTPFNLNNNWLFCGTWQFASAFSKYELLTRALEGRQVNLGIPTMGSECDFVANSGCHPVLTPVLTALAEELATSSQPCYMPGASPWPQVIKPGLYI